MLKAVQFVGVGSAVSADRSHRFTMQQSPSFDAPKPLGKFTVKPLLVMLPLIGVPSIVG
jgi:hypothetical protein